MNNTNKRLIWVDVETTGLDPEKDILLEVAAVITDEHLVALSTYEAVIWHPKSVLEEKVSPFIKQMHGRTYHDQEHPSLLELVELASLQVSDVEKKLLKFLWWEDIGPGEGVLAGSSIHFDRSFLKKHMPLLETFFYHRMFDVSALKTAAKMWCPELLPPPPKAHRALADVRASINLAKVFKPVFEMFRAVVEHDKENS